MCIAINPSKNTDKVGESKFKITIVGDCRDYNEVDNWFYYSNQKLVSNKVISRRIAIGCFGIT